MHHLLTHLPETASNRYYFSTKFATKCVKSTNVIIEDATIVFAVVVCLFVLHLRSLHPATDGCVRVKKMRARGCATRVSPVVITKSCGHFVVSYETSFSGRLPHLFPFFSSHDKPFVAPVVASDWSILVAPCFLSSVFKHQFGIVSHGLCRVANVVLSIFCSFVCGIVLLKLIIFVVIF